MYSKFNEYYQKKKDLLKLLHSNIKDDSDNSDIDDIIPKNIVI